MLISTRGRYALRVLVDMAEQQNGGYVPLKDIATRQDISEKYLESIVKALVREGILIGLRGKGGGYQLSKPPENFTVGQILRLCEGTLAPVACLTEDASPCPRRSECRTAPLWEELNRRISEYVDGITIADLVRKDEQGNEYVI